MTKKELKPGMLVTLRSGENAIVAIDDGINHDNDSLMICWDNGKALLLKDYNEDLTYIAPPYKDDCKEYNIDIVYNIGDFSAPFNMDPNRRLKLWERDKMYLSYKDQCLLRLIMDMLNRAYHHDIGPYFIKRKEGNLFIKAEYLSSKNTRDIVLALPATALYGFMPENMYFSMEDLVDRTVWER